MAARNPDSVSGSNQAEFHPSKPRDEPQTTHGVRNTSHSDLSPFSIPFSTYHVPRELRYLLSLTAQARRKRR